MKFDLFSSFCNTYQGNLPSSCQLFFLPLHRKRSLEFCIQIQYFLLPTSSLFKLQTFIWVKSYHLPIYKTFPIYREVTKLICFDRLIGMPAWWVQKPNCRPRFDGKRRWSVLFCIRMNIYWWRLSVYTLSQFLNLTNPILELTYV